jgi:hypothetical protein
MVKQSTGIAPDPEVAINGFARRMTGYKCPLPRFTDTERFGLTGADPVQLRRDNTVDPCQCFATLRG